MNDADEDQVEEELEPVWRALLALAPQFAALDVLPDDWRLKDVCEVNDLCVSESIEQSQPDSCAIRWPGLQDQVQISLGNDISLDSRKGLDPPCDHRYSSDRRCCP